MDIAAAAPNTVKERAARDHPLHWTIVNGLIRQSLIEEAPEWEKRFCNAPPFRHVVVDNFLTLDFCKQLRRDFPLFDIKQAFNEFGEVGGKVVVEKFLNFGASYQKFDELIQSRQFLDLVSKMTGIPDLLYDPQYCGGGIHENCSGQDPPNPHRFQLPPHHADASPGEADHFPESGMG